MKRSLLYLLVLPGLAATSASSKAATVTENFNFNSLNLAVPDGNLAGVANLQNITSTIQMIESMTLTLNITGTFNGDLYAYVQHGSGLSILLNRSGRTASNAFGYGDDGFGVTFSDGASNDVHVYQLTLTPAPGTPLTGTWQPDGRNVNPNVVLDSTPRTAPLSTFNTQAASGDWTLFVADVVGGDSHTVTSWSMSITGDNIPEPGAAVLAALAGAGLVLRRRR